MVVYTVYSFPIFICFGFSCGMNDVTCRLPVRFERFTRLPETECKDETSQKSSIFPANFAIENAQNSGKQNFEA